MVREFYALYLAIVTDTKPTKDIDIYQPLLLITLVRGVLVDILERTIRYFFYGLEYEQPSSTTKYDNQMSIVRIQTIKKRC